MFFHFLSFSFIFFDFSFSFSFIFFVFVGCSKSDFFLGLNFVTISLDNSFVKNQFLGPSRVVHPFGPSFPFFPTFFFSRFFCLFSCFFFFQFLSFFVHFFIFWFLNVFHFLFSFFPKKKFLLFFFLVFLSNILYCWRKYQSLTVFLL